MEHVALREFGDNPLTEHITSAPFARAAEQIAETETELRQKKKAEAASKAVLADSESFPRALSPQRSTEASDEEQSVPVKPPSAKRLEYQAGKPGAISRTKEEIGEVRTETAPAA